VNESFATVLETVGDLRRDRLAVSHGDRTRTWAELDERAARLAGHLAAQGIGPESRVAVALYNGIEYLESVYAILKLRAVPVNVNYRYRRDEIVGLLEDAQAEAVIFDASLAERFGAARPALPRLRALVQVGGDGDLPGWAVDYDHWLMYTGGTTGRPKGVLVRHSWLYGTCCANGFLLLGEAFPQTPADLRATLQRLGPDRDAMVCLPAPPLMHSTGMYTTFGALLAGGRVVYLPSKSYDPGELAATVQRERVDTVSIVGDVFARPLADALDEAEAAGRPYDLSSLRRIISVGVTWSADVKQRLLHHADIVCRDLVAATEGGPFAVAETRRGDETATARFRLLPGARVIDERGADVVPGSGQIGVLGAPADEHIRYQGDDEATARTFPEIGGRRFVVPGDMASLEADGTVVFHGRGSRVINTGGEKVFAEEVEQVLLTHPAVRDVMVVGAADQRWGSRIVAVVSLHPGAELPQAEASAYVGDRLADHKRPRDLVVVDELRRSPSGKADLTWARGVATALPRP
jgi:acyl-CoA synthetase (AMP-forming)/AMP-acid ligase II